MDRNRNGGGVACYIRSDISYVQKDFFPNVIENIFFEILLPKTTPITVEMMYRPPSQTNFLEILNMTFEKVHIDKYIDKEIYILGDFNINMYHNKDMLFVMITRFFQSSCLMMLKIITNFLQCMA